MQFPDPLLFGNPAGYRAVNFICQPVFARHRFQLNHIFNQRIYITRLVLQILKIRNFRFIFQNRFWRTAKHVSQLPVDGFFAGFRIFKSELHIAGGLPYFIYRCPFAAGNSFQQFYIFGFHHQSHAFLRFIPYNFFLRKCGIAHRQFGRIDFSTGSFHQFRKTVQVSPCPVVMYRNNRIAVRFTQCTNGIVHPFLHFRIGALHGIQFNGIFKFAGSYR